MVAPHEQRLLADGAGRRRSRAFTTRISWAAESPSASTKKQVQATVTAFPWFCAMRSTSSADAGRPSAWRPRPA
jgi:hypothetical protein